MTLVNAANDPYAFTVGDRMKKSLKVAGLSRAEMADYLGVVPETVSTWMNDRIQPNVQTMRLWALKTGAPYAWIVSGDTPQGPDGVHPPGLEPGTHCIAVVTPLRSRLSVAA